MNRDILFKSLVGSHNYNLNVETFVIKKIYFDASQF